MRARAGINRAARPHEALTKPSLSVHSLFISHRSLSINSLNDCVDPDRGCTGWCSTLPLPRRVCCASTRGTVIRWPSIATETLATATAAYRVSSPSRLTQCLRSASLVEPHHIALRTLLCNYDRRERIYIRACVLYPQVARPSGLSARATTLHGGVLTRRSVSMRRFATTPPS